MGKLQTDQQILIAPEGVSVGWPQSFEQFSKAVPVLRTDQELVRIGSTVPAHRHRLPAVDQLGSRTSEFSPTVDCVSGGLSLFRSIPALHGMDAPTIADGLAEDLDRLSQWRSFGGGEDALIQGKLYRKGPQSCPELGRGLETVELRIGVSGPYEQICSLFLRKQISLSRYGSSSAVSNAQPCSRRQQEGREYLDLLLREPEISRIAGPGQFLMIRAWPGVDPLLPRPFDIMQCDPREQTLRLFVKVEGRGTALLKSLNPGSRGQNNRPPRKTYRGLFLFLVGVSGARSRGGGGGASGEAGRARGIVVYTILSASTASRIVCRKYLEPLSTELLIGTDDGSEGYDGLASDLLDDLLRRKTMDRVYTCGSRRFARHVQRLDRAGQV